MVRIKNCGLTTPEAINEAARTGASYVGFVHHHASPRHVTLAEMAALTAHTRTHAPLQSVAVLVAPDDGLLDALVAQAKPDMIQLHEVTEADRISYLRARYHLPVIAAISISQPSDLLALPALEIASDHLLFDAKTPGSGQPFDWSILAQWRRKTAKPWLLSGGLNVTNIADAIRITRAPMVDVSSGIESSRGVKSLEMIAAFNAAVLNAGA